MCRNQTFLRAIEDLANNITISYLSSSDLANDNTTFRDIPTSDTWNFYVYHPLYLVLSYGIGPLFTSMAAVISLYSIWINGVSHSMSFSALMATTRNPDLDRLTHGSSLGAAPLKTYIENMRLRFGPLLSKHKDARDPQEEGGVPHIAFGFEQSVGYLKKGAKHV
jgi:hypothetical protein